MTNLPLLDADAGTLGPARDALLQVSHHADGTLRGVCTVINVHDFGAIGDGNSHPLSERYTTQAEAQAAYPTLSAPLPTDEIDWAAIQATLDACVAAGGGEVCIPEGIYKLNRVLVASFATNAHITLRGMKRAVLDMTAAPKTATHVLLTVGGQLLDPHQVVPLAADVQKGDHAISFDTLTLAVTPGEVLLITSSEYWEPWLKRPKGEMVEVEAVTDGGVLLRSALFDSYLAATTKVFKLATPTVRVEDLEIQGDGPHLGLSVQYARDIEVKGCRCTGARYAAFQLKYVFGGLFANNFATDFFDPNQSQGAPAAGVNYGLAIGSCQYITTMGNRLFGGRHALSHGGWEPVRCIVHTGNVLDNEHTYNPHQPCLDVHADAEFIEVTGNIILNGVTCNGRNVAINHNLITGHHQPCIALLPTQRGAYYRVSNNELLSDDYYGLLLRAQGDDATIDSVYISGNIIKVASEGISIGVGLPPYDFTGLVLDNVELDGNDVVTTTGFALRAEGRAAKGALAAKTVQINRLAVTGGRYRSGYNCFHTAALTQAGHLLMRGVYLLTHRADGGPPVALNSSDFAHAQIEGCWLESEVQPGYWNTLAVTGEARWINNVVKNFTMKGGLNLTAATLTFQNNTHENCQGQLNLAGSGKVQNPRTAAGKVQTANTTPAVVSAYTLGDNTVAEIVASVLAHDSSGHMGAYRRRASVKRHLGGPAVLIGAVDTIGVDKADVAAWKVKIVVAGNDVHVIAIGEGGVVDWSADVEITLFKG